MDAMLLSEYENVWFTLKLSVKQDSSPVFFSFSNVYTFSGRGNSYPIYTMSASVLQNQTMLVGIMFIIP